MADSKAQQGRLLLQVAVPLGGPPLEPGVRHISAADAQHPSDRSTDSSRSRGKAGGSQSEAESAQQGRGQSGNAASPLGTSSQPIPVPGPSRAMEGNPPFCKIINRSDQNCLAWLHLTQPNHRICRARAEGALYTCVLSTPAGCYVISIASLQTTNLDATVC